MAITSACGSESPEIHPPLLPYDNTESSDGYKDRPGKKSNSRGWKSASSIIGAQVAERFAYNGIDSNLITYLTGPLGQPTGAAAEYLNAWSGTAFLLPLLGGFVADSFLGKYRTILMASLIYVLGLSLLTVSAMLPSGAATSDCPNTNTITTCSPNSIKVILFFFSLCLVAIGQCGFRPCIEAFGADQFDEGNPEECKAKSSFFNWLFFGSCVGILMTHLILVYIQDNLSWALGFGIPCIAMLIAFFIFLLGAKTYRCSSNVEDKSAFLRIGRVFIAAARNWKSSPIVISLEEEAPETLPLHNSEQFKFLNRALLAPSDSMADGNVCNLSEIEEAKAVLRLVPIWATSLLYAVVFAQSTTFFTKQGKTMDRSISKDFTIPPASFQSFSTIATVSFIPIYDRVFVPIARALTKKHSGITMLQRIGIGMVISILALVICAIVEMKRLQIAQEYGIVDMPEVTVPMSAWWLVPQYVLFGISDVFTLVGLQEFFYDQVPCELRSVGVALYLSIFGMGSYISSFLISTIDNVTGGEGHDSWFATNLNRGHLDYFYWLLAVLSSLQLLAYLHAAKNYMYNPRSLLVHAEL